MDAMAFGDNLIINKLNFKQMNINAIKDRLKKLQSTSAKTTLIWKPSNGENTIRIVPYQFDQENPFIELLFHYNISKKSTLSLATFDEADPIVDFANTLASTGVKEDWILSKKIEPKMRTYVPIIVRGQEAEGVKFWGFGKEVYTQLLEFISDPDYGDITDLNTGRDVVITYTAGVTGKSFPIIGMRIKPNVSKATTDKQVLELINNGQTNIFDIYTKPTYDELKRMLQEWLEPESKETNTESTPKKSVKQTTNEVDLSDALVEEPSNITSMDAGTLDDFDKLFEE